MSVPKSTRRQFTKSLAGLAALPLFLPNGVSAAQEPAEGITSAEQALAELIRLRYAKHLTEAQRKLVRQRIEAQLASAERMKKIVLKNSDDPVAAFSADIP